MLLEKMGRLSNIQSKKIAAVDIFFVYGLDFQQPKGREAFGDLNWCKERLREQHAEARIMAYAFEESYTLSSIFKAARHLLSELDKLESEEMICCENQYGIVRSKDQLETLRSMEQSENVTMNVQYPTPPVLFICQGLAGLVVKKALLLATSRSNDHPIIQRTFGIIFLGTPHSGDVRSWADKTLVACGLDHENSSNWERKKNLESGKGLADIVNDFQRVSSSYLIVNFCEEDRPECGGANFLHVNDICSMLSQDHVTLSKESHYILPNTTSADLARARVECAVVSMRKLAAVSRRNCHKYLESERGAQNIYTQQRLPNSCKWLFARDDYLEWATADGPACLWVSGLPGAGKTILFSALVDDLVKRQQERDVVVFCFLDEERNDFARHILQVLICQLNDRHTLPDLTLHSILTEIESAEEPMSREVFRGFLRKSLGTILHQTRIALVLDALDEEEWIKSIVIDEIVRVNKSRCRSSLCRCAISSRKILKNTTHTGHVRSISLDNELGVQRDVLHFAESRLAAIFHSTDNVEKPLSSLARKICFQAQGIFMWVAFVIENLRHTDTLAELEKKVESLPPRIDDLYQQALQNIPSNHIKVVRKIFSWLIAARRPMHLSELLVALAIEPDPRVTLENPESERAICNIRFPEKEIPQMCSSLVTITEEKTVRFIHESVRRYLKSTGDPNSRGTSMLEAHMLLAQTCLVLITPGENQNPPTLCEYSQRLQAEPSGCNSSLRAYASANWSFHCRVAEPHSRVLAGTLHRSLTITLHHYCKTLLLPENRRPIQIATTTLRISAYYGFVSLTRVCLEMGAPPDGNACTCCDTPLGLAAARGHSDAVAILLQKGASTNAKISSSGGTALHLAATNGSLETAKLLLKYGVNTNEVASGSGRTPLHDAAASGHLDIIKLLIDHGADLNAVLPISQETPLHLAASNGRLQAVKWLVEGLSASEKEVECYTLIVQQPYYQSWTEDLLTDSAKNKRLAWSFLTQSSAKEDVRELESLSTRYAEIERRTREGRTALHLAAVNGHESTVRFLIQKGSKIEMTDNNQCTALRLAAEKGHLAIVKLLLAAGADLSADIHQLGATLKNVAENGHDTVANLLAWHCFSLEVLGKPCQWPMLSLATTSKQSTIRDAIRRKRGRDGIAGRRPRTRASFQERNM